MHIFRRYDILPIIAIYVYPYAEKKMTTYENSTIGTGTFTQDLLENTNIQKNHSSHLWNKLGLAYIRNLYFCNFYFLMEMKFFSKYFHLDGRGESVRIKIIILIIYYCLLFGLV